VKFNPIMMGGQFHELLDDRPAGSPTAMPRPGDPKGGPDAATPKEQAALPAGVGPISATVHPLFDAAAIAERSGALVHLRRGADMLDVDRRSLAAAGNVPALCYDLNQLGAVLRHLYGVRDSLENAIIRHTVDDMDNPAPATVALGTGQVAEVYWDTEQYRPRNRWRVRISQGDEP